MVTSRQSRSVLAIFVFMFSVGASWRRLVHTNFRSKWGPPTQATNGDRCLFLVGSVVWRPHTEIPGVFTLIPFSNLFQSQSGCHSAPVDAHDTLAHIALEAQLQAVCAQLVGRVSSTATDYVVVCEVAAHKDSLVKEGDGPAHSQRLLHVLPDLYSKNCRAYRRCNVLTLPLLIRSLSCPRRWCLNWRCLNWLRRRLLRLLYLRLYPRLRRLQLWPFRWYRWKRRHTEVVTKHPAQDAILLIAPTSSFNHSCQCSCCSLCWIRREEFPQLIQIFIERLA